MTLDAPTYLEHLRAYVNDDYIVDGGAGGRVVLAEEYYRPEDLKPRDRKIELLLPGAGMAIKLDYKNAGGSRRSRPPLFHFLDDTGKPWSRRCDFVVFYVCGRAFHADCIEFKSKSLNAEKIVPQLNAGTSWVNALKRTIEHYTGDRRRIRVRKFVFGDNESPDAYLDLNGQLKADPSIRYYHYREVQGQPLRGLSNTSVKEV